MPARENKEQLLERLGHVQPIWRGDSSNDCSLVKTVCIVLGAVGLVVFAARFAESDAAPL